MTKMPSPYYFCLPSGPVITRCTINATFYPLKKKTTNAVPDETGTRPGGVGEAGKNKQRSRYFEQAKQMRKSDTMPTDAVGF